MIDDLPVVDIHVHVPGTITPHTAWELGVTNGFIAIEEQPDGSKTWRVGPRSLSPNDPHQDYTDIFRKENGDIALDWDGKPQRLEYDLGYQSFKQFDRIMATVQGHRHPPGGIQTEEDYKLVLRAYLKSCVEQKVFYTELQQNIRIAHQLYPDLEPAKARRRFVQLLRDIQQEYKRQGVHLRFLHCFNKTGIANDGKTPCDRALEGAQWLHEAHDIAPGVFVGLESAGHEKDRSGWPEHLKPGYDMASHTFGCEAHAGEGIGVEHMLDVVRTLPITRLAHGFQAIEDERAIREVKDCGITLVMTPSINIALGSPVHKKQDSHGNSVPASQSKGGQPEYITRLHEHPFFTLLRDHQLSIALGSDNPGMAGVTIKEMIAEMAGLSSAHPFPSSTPPLSAEELAVCSFNAIDAAFCNADIKRAYVEKLLAWMRRYGIEVEHKLAEAPHGQHENRLAHRRGGKSGAQIGG